MLGGFEATTVERIPGIGVRAKTAIGGEVSEFVIRESRDGNEALSVVSEGGLVQVVTSKRNQIGAVTLEKHMITKNVETFSHYRYDWLDNFKFIWWGFASLGIVLLIIMRGMK